MTIFKQSFFECFDERVSSSLEQYRGRYAPSPTGELHLGNIRTALLSWLKARIENGKWYLRIDDLDTSRNRVGASECIQEQLKWLGLGWDGPVIFQSTRKKIYQATLDELKRIDRLYACKCSRKELINGQNSKVKNDIYQETCKTLRLPWDKYRGKTLSWRLKVGSEFQKSSGDIILRRADGVVSYHFATVVDEIMLGITEVIRGEDLYDSEISQLSIYDAFNLEPKEFKYVPLFYDSSGKKLSKRDSSQGVNELIAKGISSEKLIGLLASSLDLVPKGTLASSSQLLEMIKRDRTNFYKLFNNYKR
tara:strand:- start:5902 stop:6822 length:921 start_codon:yes stop_codon:yes gene_type:complete